jgi:serine/threonine protein phosphatase 1
MSNVFVIGDMHGAFKAMLQCLRKCNFNPQTDTLICLGDVVDGWPETKQCIDYLISLPNLIMISGNHEEFAMDWAKTGKSPTGWEAQGGYATIESYNGQMSNSHLQFLEQSIPYYLSDNQLFVHAGLEISKPLENQSTEIFMWDRSLFRSAFPHRNEENPPKLTKYKSIYIGHTPIHRYGYDHPVQACEVWMMDTGAGWDGVLSIMDINTNEYWTSDHVNTLYPEHKGRFI